MSSATTPRRRDHDHTSSRRTREVYRYFRPKRSFPTIDENASLSLDENTSSTHSGSPRLTPPALAPADNAHRPPLSPSSSFSASAPSPPADHTPSSLLPEELVLGDANATLTSFAQLAALRLDMERVMISVSDRNSQHIIAQAGQTRRGDDDLESLDGGLWNGCQTLSSSVLFMCMETIALPPSDRSRKLYSCHVVSDLAANERYRDLPFVKGEPHFRFYAGTPLTTEANVNIGSIFMLDSRTREDLDASERETLGMLSSLVMDYLKVSRQASEGRRAARVSRGLSYFVEGSSSFVDNASAFNVAPAPGTPPPSHTRRNHLSVDSGHSFEGPSHRRSHSSRRSPSHSSDAHSVSSVSEYRGEPSSGLNTPLPDWWASTRQTGLDESQGSTWAFRRAANLLRESLELSGDGGVIFLDAGHSPMGAIDPAGESLDGDSAPAPTLAISTNEEPFAPRPGSRALYPAANLANGFLHQILHRHSKGRLWSFHQDGMVSSSDDERSPQRSASRANKSTEPGKGPKKWKATENAMLNRYFPGASQVMFVPLWNPANSQWFAGCFCWNIEETRVFSPDVELSAVIGFGSSIMAECSRLQSLISDRQKGDFIGSISHELRSPLHGILAAAEFLQGTELDEFQDSLLETINACGRTLLDTMNQVLDFSKIVSLERTWRHKQRNTSQSDLKPIDQMSARLDTYVATDMAILAEEVVEGVCLGHSYGQMSTTLSDLPTPASSPGPEEHSPVVTSDGVEVTVDIAQHDWLYQTQPGALRRIIMNVFGNAMKYTESGRVSLHLAVADASERHLHRPRTEEEVVTLTVTDTGKGISEEFLRGRLYTPFAQEDTLAVGTGLGLSIVRSLVKALGGSISIQSRPGEGTTVRVSLPLERPSPVEAGLEDDGPNLPSPTVREKTPLRSESVPLRESHAGRRVAILGVEPAVAATHPRWGPIARYLTDWYGLQLVPWSSMAVDVALADEEGLASASGTGSTLPRILLLCNRSVSTKNLQPEWLSTARSVSQLRLPCGPQKLARSIRRCLDHQSPAAPASGTVVLPHRPRNRSQPSDISKSGSLPELSTGLSSDSGFASSVGSSAPSETLVETTVPVIALPSLSAELATKTCRSPCVLVVDDNSINLNLMLMFMKKRHLSTLHSAENGQVAVEAVERLPQNYDIIFMDMSMPVMDGFEATRAIRALEKERDAGPGATIVALTGLSSSKDESEALMSGVDLFLTKPVSFKEVSRLLDEWEAVGLREPRLQLCV